MNINLPFAYVAGSDKIEFDFTELRKDTRYVLNDDQVLRGEQVNYLKGKTPKEMVTDHFRILEDYKDLKDLILRMFNSFCTATYGQPFKFKISTSWLTKLQKGDSIQPHNHGNCFYSGILYYGDNYVDASSLFLLNPLSGTLANQFALGNRSHPTHDSWFITPEEGGIHFWPSCINHYAKKNKSEDRVSLAFNFILTEPVYSFDSSFDPRWI
ncbi:MAG TPA: hypothetical protein DEO99_07635 [Bacteroidetes bacterium]|nr:hypothetical protein [Marinovum sp.]HCE86012.1 hypothetical protein [Bacteroidota bacterium]|tara:strand:- start:5426 stop:6061 length:636 start_codon:yes stop_codon:yes gene_type:complete